MSRLTDLIKRLRPSHTAQVVIGRLAAAVLAAAITATAKGHIPRTTGEAVSLAAGAVVGAAPGIFQAAGILRAVTPGQQTLWDRAAAGVRAVIDAPADARRQALVGAVADARPEIVAEVLRTLQGRGGAEGGVTAENLAAAHTQIAGADRARSAVLAAGVTGGSGVISGSGGSGGAADGSDDRDAISVTGGSR